MGIEVGAWVYQDPDFPHRRGYEWGAALWVIESKQRDEMKCKHLNSGGTAIRQTFPVGSLHAFPRDAQREPQMEERNRCSWVDEDGRAHAIIVSQDDLDRFDADSSTAAK